MLNPSKIICVGLNYHQHARELGMNLPDEPIIFLKPVSSLIYQDQDIIYPEGVRELDYEGELAVIIGNTAKNINQAEAYDYVAGYTIANDVTARDLQRKDGQWTRAKSFDTFCPVLDKSTLVDDPHRLSLKTYLNGELKQDSSTSDMIFKIDEIIAFISRIMTLNRGDIILTGTPSGIGHMKRGDQIRVEIEGIGVLENRVL